MTTMAMITTMATQPYWKEEVHKEKGKERSEGEEDGKEQGRGIGRGGKREERVREG